MDKVEEVILDYFKSDLIPYKTQFPFRAFFNKEEVHLRDGTFSWKTYEEVIQAIVRSLISKGLKNYTKYKEISDLLIKENYLIIVQKLIDDGVLEIINVKENKTYIP